MPKFDRSGPLGQGPRTGRGAGRCGARGGGPSPRHHEERRWNRDTYSGEEEGHGRAGGARGRGPCGGRSHFGRGPNPGPEADPGRCAGDRRGRDEGRGRAGRGPGRCGGRGRGRRPICHERDREPDRDNGRGSRQEQPSERLAEGKIEQDTASDDLSVADEATHTGEHLAEPTPQ